ncbi:hypothetical protein [Rhizobium alarense]|nr:hypothetical protein [Rhizobium alarense]
MTMILPALAALIAGMFAITMFAALSADRREAQQIRVRAERRRGF